MDVASLAIQLKTGDVQKGVKELDKLTEAGKDAEKATDSLTSSFESLTGVVKAYINVQAGLKIVKLTDEYTKFTAQLNLATRSQDEYNAALDDVRRISTDAQSSLTSTAVLFARITNGTRELGVTQKQVADVTETVSLALKVSGATAEESASAMLQLSQAFASGVLRGEEFNAVNEAAPRLMKALADGLGVPIGALREMAQNGKITSEIMAKVLPKALETLREEAKSVQTISGAFQVFSNVMLESVGSAAQATGASEGLSKAISDIAKEIADSKLVYNAATVFFQTLAIVGSDAGFVMLSVGREIGAIAAQLAALGRGDFAGFRAISEAVKEDAVRARAELDAFQARVMGGANAPTKKEGTTTTLGAVPKGLTTAEKNAIKEREKLLIEAEQNIFNAKNQAMLDSIDAQVEADFQAAKKQADEQIRLNKEVEDERIKMQRQRIMDESDARFKAIEDERREQKKLTDHIKRDLTSALARAFESGKDPAAAFAQGLASTIFSRVSAALADALITGAMNKMGGGGGSDLFGSLLSLGSMAFGNVSTAMQFGTNIGSQQTSMLAAQMAGFEGGGFTGSGSRSGGMDGRGGFMAMLHPNETVIDHTKGGAGQVVYAPVIQIDSRTDRGEVMRLVQSAVQNGNNQLVDRLQRQGRI